MQVREKVDAARFNQAATLPYSLRLDDFQIAMEDVYDFFFDVNNFFLERGLPRLDDLLRPANMSGLLSDMLTASIAKHSRGWRRGGRDQDDAEEGRRGRHSRRPQPVDVRLCLPCR